MWVAPLKSTACPPGRMPSFFSTTVTSWPERCSQKARAGPAMLAPEIRMRVMGTPRVDGTTIRPTAHTPLTRC